MEDAATRPTSTSFLTEPLEFLPEARETDEEATMSEYTVSEGGHLYWSVRDAKTGRFVSRKVWAARNRAIASRARLAERRMAYALYLEARVSKAEEADPRPPAPRLDARLERRPGHPGERLL
jgi:hypothetical protein